MEKITGIGGFFFRAKDPEKLNQWYEQHLGVRKAGLEYEDGSWWQDEGPTVFAAEARDAQVRSAHEYSWRFNFRVRNLDAMVAQLRAAGITWRWKKPSTPMGDSPISRILRRISSNCGNPPARMHIARLTRRSSRT